MRLFQKFSEHRRASRSSRKRDPLEAHREILGFGIASIFLYGSITNAEDTIFAKIMSEEFQKIFGALMSKRKRRKIFPQNLEQHSSSSHIYSRATYIYESSTQKKSRRDLWRSLDDALQNEQFVQLTPKESPSRIKTRSTELQRKPLNHFHTL